LGEKEDVDVWEVVAFQEALRAFCARRSYVSQCNVPGFVAGLTFVRLFRVL
jgi:hypothetical protein